METNHTEENHEDENSIELPDPQPSESTNQTAVINRKDLPGQSMTVQIDDLPEIEDSADWGSAFLGKRAQLQLEVAGLSEASIQVTIKDQLVIGRESSDSPEKPDLDLSPYGAARLGVSRRHIMITKEGNILKVVDLGSTNGTYLNGVPLRENQPRVLRTGDKLSLGHLLVTVVGLS
jgi:pSer/pThr/pTyr-binding forkhead associated (FHA) protein